MKPRFAKDCIAPSVEMCLAYNLSHVLGVKNQIVPSPEENCKEGISESSQCAASYSCRAKELVKIFLSDLVWILLALSKIVC